MRSSHEGYEIETWSDIEPIRSRSKAIESSGGSTPFQSYAWVSPLLDSVGRSFDAELHILIVKDRKTGEDLMLLPLVRRRAQLLRFLEIPDFSVSDYNSPIISRSIVADKARVAEVWDTAMRALPASDVLYLQKIPQILSDVLNPLVDLKGFRPECYSSWQLALPENLTELEQKTLSSATRRQIRRRTRPLEETGALSYIAPNSEAEKKALFDVLRQQRQSRFAALGRNNILASPAHSGFYDLILQSRFDPEVLTVHGLKVGDETIATAFGLYWQKRFYLLMSTMASGNWLEVSPGMVMIWKLIAHICTRKVAGRSTLRSATNLTNVSWGPRNARCRSIFVPVRPSADPMRWVCGFGLRWSPSSENLRRQLRRTRRIVPKNTPTPRVRRDPRVLVTATGIEKSSKSADCYSLR